MRADWQQGGAAAAWLAVAAPPPPSLGRGMCAARGTRGGIVAGAGARARRCKGHSSRAVNGAGGADAHSESLRTRMFARGANGDDAGAAGAAPALDMDVLAALADRLRGERAAVREAVMTAAAEVRMAVAAEGDAEPGGANGAPRGAAPPGGSTSLPASSSVDAGTAPAASVEEPDGRAAIGSDGPGSVGATDELISAGSDAAGAEGGFGESAVAGAAAVASARNASARNAWALAAEEGSRGSSCYARSSDGGEGGGGEDGGSSLSDGADVQRHAFGAAAAHGHARHAPATPPTIVGSHGRQTPPHGYVCHRCNIPGHWRNQCPAGPVAGVGEHLHDARTHACT